MHTETTAAKAFRTYIRVYPFSKSKLLSANIKLTFHKALIRYKWLMPAQPGSL
jgi:hypothetical protein